MLKAFLAEKERELLARSRVAGLGGHSLNKGVAREKFIDGFLRECLGGGVDFGTGEIIDTTSMPSPPPQSSRRQIDIVVYDRSFPKLHLSDGATAFLAESVIATIEVKSTLTRAGLGRALSAAAALKAMKRLGPDHIRCYLVAYDGPTQMRTIHRWLAQAYSTYERGDDDSQSRSSRSLDGIFVLGKGVVLCHDGKTGFSVSGDGRWIVGYTESGSLLVLFAQLMSASSTLSLRWAELPTQHYLHGYSLKYELLR